jgi:predicted RecA/RadA family phage recombinase
VANNFRHNGKRMPVATASEAISSGAFVVQEGFFGVALTSAALGASLWIAIDGVWVLPVPSGTVKGDVLYAPGAPATEDGSITLTKTATSNTAIGKAVGDRDSSGLAPVLLLPQA